MKSLDQDRSYEVRAVWNVAGAHGKEKESHSLDQVHLIKKRPDHYGVYRNMPNGTQKHLFDFDDRTYTLQLAGNL